MAGGGGFNGRMAIRGGGARNIRCLDIKYGVNIIATADNESRTERSFYSIVTTSSSFTMTLGFISWEDREAVNRWLHSWMSDIIQGQASSLFVTTSVPSRNFLRTSVLIGPLIYGEKFDDIFYTTELNFIGASDPVTKDMGNLRKFISRFQAAEHGEVTTRFYPAGIQVSGSESLENTFYDPTPVDVSSLVQTTDEPIDNRFDRFGQDTP